MRSHEPAVISEFNGLYQRGDRDNTPLDHFTECDNQKFFGDSSFGTRDGIGISQTVGVPLSNIKRAYNFPTQTDNTLIVLAYDEVTGIGSIHHVVNPTLTYGPLLSIEGMMDFAFQPYNGRGYISPFASLNATLVAPGAVSLSDSPGLDLPYGTYKYAVTFVTDVGETTPSSPSTFTTVSPAASSNILVTLPLGDSTVIGRKVYRTEESGDALFFLANIADNTTTSYDDNLAVSLGAAAPTVNTATLAGLRVEKGLQGEFLYVYAGDGTAARKAGGIPISGTLTIADGATGYTDNGFHLFGFVTESISGALSAPGAITGFTTSSLNGVSFGNVPATGNPLIVKRHLVTTKIINDYNGDPTGYTFYYVANATINNDTDTFLNNINFYDADLLDDASHLFDNYTDIPAGAVLTLYHNRLCLATTFTDISLILVSAAGEPESFDQINGLIIVPLDGNPITNAQELRDILYVFKRARTVSYVDNGDVPSTWPLVVIDNALGTCVHGIATVLDSGAASVDYLIVCTYQGVTLFNGRYIIPELSFKIEAYWRAFDRDEFRKIQIINAPVQKEIYIVTPTKKLLVGNYVNGMDPKKIKWGPWSYSCFVNTVAVVHIDEIILGADI